MAKDIIITPADGDIVFDNSAGAECGAITQDGNDLVISNAVGDILLGDGASDIYIGDGTNNVDILFEQSGNIKAEDGSSGVTLTIGSDDTTLALGSAISSALNVGIDDTGYDVTFFGATSGKKMLWDQSADTLVVDGTLDINGNADISGTALVTGVLTSTAIQVVNGGLALATNKKIQFRDSAISISSTADGDMSIAADDEIDITSTLIDINGNVDISGTLSGNFVVRSTNNANTDGANFAVDTTNKSASEYAYEVLRSGTTVAGITITGLVTGTGFTAGSAVLTEAELELLDGLTAGTAIASKVVTTDANKDTTGQRNLTITGELDAATLDISGDADIDGTLNADGLDVDGNADISGNLTLGANLISSDGAQDAYYINAANKVYTPYTTNQWHSAAPFGNSWHDVAAFNRNYTTTQFTSTDGTNFSSETLELGLFAQQDKSSYVVIADGERAFRLQWHGVAYNVGRYIQISSTYSSPSPTCSVKIDTSADGSTWSTIHTSTGITFSASSRFYWVDGYIGNGGHQYVRVTIDKGNTDGKVVRLSSVKMLTQRLGDQGKGGEDEFPFVWDKDKNVTIQGELAATSLDIGTGGVDVNGTMEANAITLGGTALGSLYSPIAGGTGIVTTGALNAGSITSGFTSIDVGAGAITTTGLISGGSLDIDDVVINGANIGHTDDTDLIVLEDGAATVNGDLSVTGDLNITGDINTVSEVNLDVTDKTITIAKGAANSSAADGAGIVVDGAAASLLYDHTGTQWEFNKPLEVTGTVTSTGIVTGTGFTAGSAVIAESELELLDGLTAGTAIASKVVTTDANKDTTGQRNLTITGELDAATLDLSGNADIAGTLTLGGHLQEPILRTEVSVANSYVRIFTVTDASGQLATMTRLSGTSHGSGHVGNFTALIMTNHSGDVVVKSFSSFYTEVTIKVDTNTNADATISIKSDTANAATYKLKIETLSPGATYALLPSSGINAAVSHEHSAGDGSNETGVGGTLTHDFGGEINAVSLDISGDADIDGTLNADGLDIDGDADISGALTLGTVLAAAQGGTGAANLNALVQTTGTQTIGGVKTFSSIPLFPNDTIETADIQNEAVTLAKMASLDAGHIIYGDAQNAPASLAQGSDGQILTLASGLPSWSAVPAASSLAADDIGAGDAAVTVGTTSGNVTIDSNAGAVSIDGHTGVTVASSNSGDILLDSVADIVLDAAGGNIEFKDAGTLQLTLDMDGTAGAQVITLGVDNDNLIFKAHGGGAILTLDDDTSVQVAGALSSGGVITGTGFTAGNAVIAESELELLDGLTAGTAIASKVVTTDASKDTTGQRNLTITGELDAATLDLSGAADIAGALVVSAGAVSITGDGSNATVMTESGDGQFLIDTVLDMTLDFGGGDLILSDDGTIFGTISSASGMQIRSRVGDADMLFRGVNGSTEFTALTLDMSEGGNAIFAGTVTATGFDAGNGNITNIGDIDADSISVADAAIGLNIDFSGANTAKSAITIRDNIAEALVIQQGGNDYLKIVTTNSSEALLLATGVAGMDITIGHATSEVIVGDNLTVGGKLVMGSTDALTDAGLLSVANQSNITGLGTITSGVWNGTTIKTAYIHDANVTLAKLANIATNTFIGRTADNPGVPKALSKTEALAILNVVDGATADQSKSDIDGLGITTVGTIDSGTWRGTHIEVPYGGTGAQSFTNGGVLLGSGEGAITAMAVLTDGQMIVGDGTTNPVAESGATLRASIGLGTSAVLDTAAISDGGSGVATADQIHTFVTDFGYTTATGDTTLAGAQTITGVKTIGTNVKLQFRDANTFIHSNAANDLLISGTDVEIAATNIILDAGTKIDLQQATDVTGDLTVSGKLVMGSTDALTNAGLLSVANQSNITGLGTISDGVWQGTTIKTAYIQDANITMAKLADVATNTIIGRTADNAGVPKAMSATEVRAILNVVDGATADQTVTDSVSTTSSTTVASATAVKAAYDRNTNVAGNLGVSAGSTSLTITTSNGTNIAIPAATASARGCMTPQLIAAISANTDKETNEETSDATVEVKGKVALATEEEAIAGASTTKAITPEGGKAVASAVVGTKRVSDLAAPNAAFAMNSQKITGVANPTANQDAATKAYVDGIKVHELTAPTAALAMNSQKITGVTDPTGAQDAATKAYVDSYRLEALSYALSDETTVIASATSVLTARIPYAFTVTNIRANVNTVSSSGLITVDINIAGSTVLSTKLTIDASEFTSATAANAHALSDTTWADDAEIVFDIDGHGTGAKGLKITIIGYQS